MVHSWVIVVRTGCHSQILLITPNLRLTAVFVIFREGSFTIITFDLEPTFFNSHAEKALAYPVSVKCSAIFIVKSPEIEVKVGQYLWL